MIRHGISTFAAAALIFMGCEKQKETTSNKTPPVSSTDRSPPPVVGDKNSTPAATPASSNSNSSGATDQPAASGHGEGIDLGTMTVEGFAIRASRDMGQVVPGGDVPIDVWVTDGSDAPSSVAVVRFWIGQKDARGSVKARAEIENPDQPNHWHTHVEAPNPMPPDAVLWVEMETGEGKRLFASFPLLP